MPVGWIGLEYHVFLNNIFLMINWPQDGLGWNGEPSWTPIGLSEADKAPEGLQSVPYLHRPRGGR